MRPKVYIAGKISDYGVKHLSNMSKFFDMQDRLIRLGFAPLNPAADFMLGLRHDDYTYNMYFDPNAEWLKVSDAVLVLPGWETSEGAKREIKIAEKFCIPVFYDVISLIKWAENE